MMEWLANIWRTGVAVELYSPVIHDLAKILQSGPLDKVDLDRFGICELGCVYLGQKFRISWYGGMGSARMRHVSLDGDRMFTTSREGKYLLSVADERSENIFMERVRELEKRRTTPVVVTRRSA